MNAPALGDALALHRAGRLSEAEAGYRAIIAATADAEAMQLLASLLHQDGRSREALAWLDRALPRLARRNARGDLAVRSGPAEVRQCRGR